MPRPAPPAPAPDAAPNDSVPVHTIRHRSLKASIWKNDTKRGPMYKVKVVRSYREGDEWRDTQSFSYDELMNVAKLFSDAHSWISQERAREAADRPRTIAPSSKRDR
jgi:hypothetical protein